ncbi:unnamed protein product [Ixodes pacificus]
MLTFASVADPRGGRWGRSPPPNASPGNPPPRGFFISSKKKRKQSTGGWTRLLGASKVGFISVKVTVRLPDRDGARSFEMERQWGGARNIRVLDCRHTSKQGQHVEHGGQIPSTYLVPFLSLSLSLEVVCEKCVP